jgi:hypothetical protein
VHLYTELSALDGIMFGLQDGRYRFESRSATEHPENIRHNEIQSLQENVRTVYQITLPFPSFSLTHNKTLEFLSH